MFVCVEVLETCIENHELHSSMRLKTFWLLLKALKKSLFGIGSGLGSRVGRPGWGEGTELGNVLSPCRSSEVCVCSIWALDGGLG